MTVWAEAQLLPLKSRIEMNIKTLLIEDQKGVRESLKIMLERHFPVLKIVGEADSVETGYDEIVQKKPELVFFDIDIYNGTSFDIIKRLQAKGKIDFKFIFLTAHDNTQYTIKAIKYSATDYIVKPLDITKILTGVNKAIVEITEKKSHMQSIDLLLELLEKPFGQNNQIVIDSLKSTQILLKISDIISFHSDEYITRFSLKEGKTAIGNKHIGHYAKSLCADFDFFQISQSAVINLLHLENYQHATKEVTLSDGSRLVASRNGGKHLRDYLKKHEPKKMKGNFIKAILHKLRGLSPYTYEVENT